MNIGLGSVLSQRNSQARENFSYDILEEFDDVTDEFMCDRETHWIEVYASNNPALGYNLAEGGEGAPGRIWTEEQRQAHRKMNTRNHAVEGGGRNWLKPIRR